YELVWLYYNGLSDYGSEKFKPLIEKYSMLQNLREELLVDECETTLNYSDRAYNHYGEQE
ncbi:MAG: putative phage abortive infection protein, partial [Prevotella pectinovora]